MLTALHGFGCRQRAKTKQRQQLGKTLVAKTIPPPETPTGHGMPLWPSTAGFCLGDADMQHLSRDSGISIISAPDNPSQIPGPSYLSPPLHSPPLPSPPSPMHLTRPQRLAVSPPPLSPSPPHSRRICLSTFIPFQTSLPCITPFRLLLKPWIAMRA